jgi:hypothetical protein
MRAPYRAGLRRVRRPGPDPSVQNLRAGVPNLRTTERPEDFHGHSLGAVVSTAGPREGCRVARAKSTSAATRAAVQVPVRTGSKKNGASGSSEPTTAATPTTRAEVSAARRSIGTSRGSSAIMTATQTTRFAVNVTTTRSSSSPRKPLRR